jgi:hypothetical protein
MAFPLNCPVKRSLPRGRPVRSWRCRCVTSSSNAPRRKRPPRAPPPTLDTTPPSGPGMPHSPQGRRTSPSAGSLVVRCGGGSPGPRPTRVAPLQKPTPPSTPNHELRMVSPEFTDCADARRRAFPVRDRSVLQALPSRGARRGLHDLSCVCPHTERIRAFATTLGVR